MSRTVVLGGIVAALLAGVPASMHAQQVTSAALLPEVRADVLFGHQPAVQLGGGVQIPLGYYVRVGVDGAVGVRVRDDYLPSSSWVDARIDLLTRFLLDPFRQSRYGLSVGGGISLRAEPGDHVRPLLLAALDVEGRRWSSGWVPALQVGLGGGARVGIVLRKGAARAR